MKVYTVKEISQILGTNPETVRRWIRNGKLKAVQESRKGGHVVSQEDLIEFLEKNPKYASIAEPNMVNSSASLGILSLGAGILGPVIGGAIAGIADNKAMLSQNNYQSFIKAFLNENISRREASIQQKKALIRRLQEKVEKEQNELETLKNSRSSMKSGGNMINADDFRTIVKIRIMESLKRYDGSRNSQDVLRAVAKVLMDEIADGWEACRNYQEISGQKIVYYISSEFLPGRMLGNTLLNVSAFEAVKEALEEWGCDINAVEDAETEAALGRGGFGRFAACLLESLATKGYPAYGCGLHYQYGERQTLYSGRQQICPDIWLDNGYPFEVCRPELSRIVRFGGEVVIKNNTEKNTPEYVLNDSVEVKAVPYDIPVIGYGNGQINTVRLWKAEPVKLYGTDEPEQMTRENAEKVIELSQVSSGLSTARLCPHENYLSAKCGYIRQQYFLVSAAIQDAIERYKENHQDIHRLYEKVVFHLNEMYAALAVPELMRILMDEEHLTWDEAWEIISKCCTFTVTTNMGRAYNAVPWSQVIFSETLPRISMIIEEIDRRFHETLIEKFPEDAQRRNEMRILCNGEVNLLNLAVAACYAVNGVSRMHTKQLAGGMLKGFYEMKPQKFISITNGFTQRRFLLHANPALTAWLTEKIGDGWITDFSQIERMKDFADIPDAQREFMNIKAQNKLRLAEYIRKHTGIEVDPSSMFDVQAKKVYGYKRHLLNALHVLYLFNRLKNDPEMDFYPRTFIFSGSAEMCDERGGPYETIRLIIRLADIINNNETVNGKLKVVFLENYNVSLTELLCAAADVSEQIPTAGKEASGTGNMKFIANGALIIGTRGGANVEIEEAVGEDNIFMFGLTADEIRQHEENGQYCPDEYKDKDADLCRILDQLKSREFFVNTDFSRIYDDLMVQSGSGKSADKDFILADFRSYAEAHERVEQAYRDRAGWARKAIVNIAGSGRFSADRAAQEYADRIWHL